MVLVSLRLKEYNVNKNQSTLQDDVETLEVDTRLLGVFQHRINGLICMLGMIQVILLKMQEEGWRKGDEGAGGEGVREKGGEERWAWAG